MPSVSLDSAAAALEALNTKLFDNREDINDLKDAKNTRVAQYDAEIAQAIAGENAATAARVAKETAKDIYIRETDLKINALLEQNSAIKDEYGPLFEALGQIKKIRDDTDAMVAEIAEQGVAATAKAAELATKEAQLAAKEAELADRESKLPPVEPAEPVQP